MSAPIGVLILLLMFAGILFAVFFTGFKAGRNLQAKQSLESLSDLQKAQAKANARAPQNKIQLLQRLKKSNF